MRFKRFLKSRFFQTTIKQHMYSQYPKEVPNLPYQVVIPRIVIPVLSKLCSWFYIMILYLNYFLFPSTLNNWKTTSVGLSWHLHRSVSKSSIISYWLDSGWLFDPQGEFQYSTHSYGKWLFAWRKLFQVVEFSSQNKIGCPTNRTAKFSLLNSKTFRF